MRQIEINQVVATHLETWNKWPDTQNTDYRDVLDTRFKWYYDLDDGTKLVINNRYYPIYYPYLAVNYPIMPIEYPWINNLIPPKFCVIDMMRIALKNISRGCQSVYWYHAQQCYPDVAATLPDIFNFKILHFGDDIPGSSEIKTFPVAKYFDALIYSMGVWDFPTGRMTDVQYHNLGLKKTYLALAGTSSGLESEMDITGFDIDQKANRVEIGELPRVDLCFVGFALGAEWRTNFMAKLNETKVSHLRTVFHGIGMRDGVLEPRLPIYNCGRIASRLYANSLFGVNPQQSSIYNSRLSDLWRCGVVQLIYDPHKELEKIGFEPYAHYIPFDGTVSGMYKQIDEYRQRHALLAEIIRNGKEAFKRVSTELNSGAVIGKMYRENIGDILK